MSTDPVACPERRSRDAREHDAPEQDDSPLDDGQDGDDGAALRELPRDATAATPRRPRRWRWLAAVLLVLLLAVGSGFLGWRDWLAQQDDRGRGRALDAAKQALPDVLSYDYANLDHDVARARSRLTASFASSYDELAAKAIRPTAVKYRAVVKADVLASSVETGDRNRASVLLFVNQTTVTSELPAPRVDQSRVRMRMEDTPTGWKVAAIEPL